MDGQKDKWMMVGGAGGQADGLMGGQLLDGKLHEWID